jgi:hypothetical protein
MSRMISGTSPACDASAVTFIPGIETQLKLRVAELQAVLLTVDNTR